MDTFLHGSDIGSPIQDISSWEECGDLCNDDTKYPKCEYWTYNQNTTLCYIQWDEPTPAIDWAICGDRNCHSVEVAEEFDCPMEDTRWGDDFLITYNVHSWEECGNICINNPDCKFWNYFLQGSFYEQCVIYWLVPAPQKGSISGDKECHS